METTELYYPQIAARAGPYTFNEGIEIEVYSAKSSYFDWAKIRFTGKAAFFDLLLKHLGFLFIQPELNVNIAFSHIFTSELSSF